MDVSVNDAGAPELLTERLLLRPLRADDEAAYTAILADPLNVRYLPGGAAGAARAAEKARHLIEHWGAAAWANGCRPWAVELRDGGLIGHLGLRFVPELGETELLYLLDRPHWGRGLATEGARAAIGLPASGSACVISSRWRLPRTPPRPPSCGAAALPSKGRCTFSGSTPCGTVAGSRLPDGTEKRRFGRSPGHFFDRRALAESLYFCILGTVGAGKAL